MTRSDVNLKYVRGGSGETPVILLHGWPQRWTSWRKVMPRLMKDFDVIAVDLRGIGDSDKPPAGYEKKTMAADLLALMGELELDRAHIVAHDIGAMIAFAFAYQWPDRARSITLIDAPMPGTEIFETIRTHPVCWHFAFHAAPEVPEALTRGREEYYYDHFMNSVGEIDEQEIIDTIHTYSDPETATAGFNLYRSFAQDVEDNKEFMQETLKVPVLGLNGGKNFNFPFLVDSLSPFVESVEGKVLDAGHWIPDTNPEELVGELMPFLSKH
ncbi:Soluble epoxide hydrolase [Fuerstiella marisgermanici]|uniref:Soluble epoxide hydrolase n=2 Tax=Fuerstiella marisgermanici TaxID=1891926 RepID=A0A1P8WBY8_9PLAN|nr:Soluble epoxide hydrolase [Fuerstiella marisgermanici]